MKKLILLISILFFTIVGQSQNKTSTAPSPISKAFLASNHEALGNEFSHTLDLSLNGYEGTYGKQQASVIMKEFFDNNKVSSFKIKHKGSSNERTQYIVCDMQSAKKKWSVYILLNKDSKIIQLQIEQE
jgi:hypothetical protein